MRLICEEYHVWVRVRAHQLQNFAHRLLHRLTALITYNIFFTLSGKRGKRLNCLSDIHPNVWHLIFLHGCKHR